MNAPSVTQPSKARPSVVINAALAALAAAAFVVLPPAVTPIANADASIPELARQGFTHWWLGGTGTPPTALERLIDQWRDYHLLKASLAALCLVPLGRVALGWQARTTGGRITARVRAIGDLSTAIAILATTLLVLANAQGAVAPLASLMSLLPPAQGTDSADRYAQAVNSLWTQLELRQLGPAASRSLDSFVSYHLVLAALYAALVIALLACALHARRRRRTRLAVSAIVVACAMSALSAANLSTVLDPVPAFASFVQQLSSPAAGSSTPPV